MTKIEPNDQPLQRVYRWEIERHNMSILRKASWLAVGIALAACSRSPSTTTAGDATEFTREANAAVVKKFGFGDTAIGMEDVTRGLIAKPEGKVLDADGKVVWDFASFDFLKQNAPATANPSLWNQARLNNEAGLFKVTEGIYQLRGFDLANITLIEGKTGWILVDPLTTRESATYALAFARKHLGDKPISGIIFTHSHIDHFGGVLGVITPEEVAKRNVPIVAPIGFMEEATSENLLLGTAMGRRSMFMYGNNLPRSATGLIDNGLGKANSKGHAGILEPNVLISGKSEELTIDGRKFIFQNVPGSEAPAEFTFAIPEFKAYCGAEMLSHTLHNLYTLRGAKVRDALKWSGYIDAATRDPAIASAEVFFGSHHWPVWGKENIAKFMNNQRDVYKYIHDQTVRQINNGSTSREVAEDIKLPKSLDDYLSVHGYYGTIKHNAKAVYQFYMGWYDANPANLDPLPPEDSAKRYVAAMGGADKLVSVAQAAFDKSEYRWAAELLNHLVFADPKHGAAKELLARCYEQMGYVAESGPWRNVYLNGAHELRTGPPKEALDVSMLGEMLEHTPIERFLEAMAANLDGPGAEGREFTLNLVFSDSKESYVLRLENSVLHFHADPVDKNADATLTLTKPLFIGMMTGKAGVKDTLLSDALKVTGSRIDLLRFLSLFAKPDGRFAVVTP